MGSSIDVPDLGSRRRLARPTCGRQRGSRHALELLRPSHEDCLLKLHQMSNPYSPSPVQSEPTTTQQSEPTSTNEHPRPSILAVIGFIYGAAFGLLFGTAFGHGVKYAITPVVTEPFVAFAGLSIMGLAWLLVTLIWRVPRRLLLGPHAITLFGSFVGGLVSLGASSTLFEVLVRANVLSYGGPKSKSELCIALFLCLASIIAGIEFEAWVGRETQPSDPQAPVSK